MRFFRDIVIMGKCNLKCLYCGGFNHELNIEKTIQCLEKILSRFEAEESCFRVELRGEILLYPELLAYLEKKVEENYRIEILSNGILAKKIISKNSKLNFVFSLDGHTEKMNSMRNLTQNQIDSILEDILEFNADIQCVYFRQTLEQMNEFILHLTELGFNRMLHIFPCFLIGEMVARSPKYDRLIKAPFLPSEEYFKKWNYILENKKRDFICDYFINGYSYYIDENGISMVKCDGSIKAHEMIHPFEEEKQFESFPCNTCINHNEYNNCREFVCDGNPQ